MAKCVLNRGASPPEKEWLEGKDDVYQTGTRCENIVHTINEYKKSVGWLSAGAPTETPSGYNYVELTKEMNSFIEQGTYEWMTSFEQLGPRWGKTGAAGTGQDTTREDGHIYEDASFVATPQELTILPIEGDPENATDMTNVFNTLYKQNASGLGFAGKAEEIVRKESFFHGKEIIVHSRTVESEVNIRYRIQQLKGMMDMLSVMETKTLGFENAKSKPKGRDYIDVWTDWDNAAEEYLKLLEALQDEGQRLISYNEQHKEIINKNADAARGELEELQHKKIACKMKAQGKGEQDVPGTGANNRARTGAKTANELCSDNQLSATEEARLKELAAVVERADSAGNSALSQLIAASQEPTRRTFKEQCLLLSHIEQFVKYRYVMDDDGTTEKRLPYKSSNLSYRAPGSAGGPSTTKTTKVRTNACLLADREPWGFMNQLVSDPSYSALFNIENKYLSQLQPMIKLYKISMDSTKDEKEIEVNFDNAFNSKFDAVLGNTKKRGFGVGIQNFTFSYEGSDPFAVKKSIKAKLSIFAASFDDLLVDRGGYKYADLALKTGRGYKDRLSFDNQAKMPALEDLNFRLKAVVGWSIPAGGEILGATDSQSRSLKDAINNSFVTLNLTPTIHEFDINDQGQVVFHINYLAYVDHFFDGPNFNIFADPEIQKKEVVRKIRMAEIQRDCARADAEKKLDNLKEDMKDEIYDDKINQLASLVGSLLFYKKIYYKRLPKKELNNFNSQGPYWKFDLFSDEAFAGDANPDSLDQSVIDGQSEQIGTKIARAHTPPTGEVPDLADTVVSDIDQNEYVAWFYLSDLIDVIMNNIGSVLDDMPAAIMASNEIGSASKKMESDKYKRLSENYKKFRVVLGPLELVTPKSIGLEHFNANLGDIPVSLSYFMDWLTDRTIKNDQFSYSLPIFLKDLLNNLVRNFLNEDRCFDINAKQRIRVFSSAVTSISDPNWTPSHADGDEITKWIIGQWDGGYSGPGPGIGLDGKSAGNKKMRRLDMYHLAQNPKRSGHVSQPLLHVFGDRNSPINYRGVDHTYNYQVFYAGRTQPQALMSGDETLDSAAGVFHFVLGKPNGIVKNIQLTKTDAPGLKEVRFEQEGYDGLMQLREVYDATITCYGSPNIFPGTYIYVNPRGFSPESKHYKDLARSVNGKNVIDNASLTRYGIGGYYMVTRAETTFGPGECETEITAKWVAELATQKSPSQHKGGSPGPRKPTKCQT
jgi:hypothetical protein